MKAKRELKKDLNPVNPEELTGNDLEKPKSHVITVLLRSGSCDPEFLTFDQDKVHRHSSNFDSLAQ